MGRSVLSYISAVCALAIATPAVCPARAAELDPCEKGVLSEQTPKSEQAPFNTRELWEKLVQIDSKYRRPSSNGLSGYFSMPMLYKKDQLWKPGVLDQIRKERKTFQELIELLPTLKAMGKNMLWLSPVHPQSTMRWMNPYKNPKDFDEYNNHFYWPSDHRTVDEMLGGETKFKELIEAARALGIEICLDTVLDHFGYGEKFQIGTPGTPDKTIELADPRYFRPIRNVTRHEQVPSWIYKAMTMSNDPDLTRQLQQDDRVPAWVYLAIAEGNYPKFVRQLQEELSRYSLANLAAFNHSNPEIRAYLIEAYKHFVDLGIHVFRLDAIKHMPQDFVYEFINSLNDYAKKKGEKLTFIAEFLEYRDSTLDVFVKDLIANVKDNERVYFLDFPLSSELRKLQNPYFGLDYMMGFVRFRENQQHPLMRYIPMLKDHDLASPMADPYTDRLVQLLAEYFSYNQAIIHHGQEGEEATQIGGREPIQQVNPDGIVNKLLNAMAGLMEPYRNSILLNQTLEHAVEPDFIAIEKVRSERRSVLLMAWRKNQNLSRTVQIPERLRGRKLRARIVGLGQTNPELSFETRDDLASLQAKRPAKEEELRDFKKNLPEFLVRVTENRVSLFKTNRDKLESSSEVFSLEIKDGQIDVKSEKQFYAVFEIADPVSPNTPK